MRGPWEQTAKTQASSETAQGQRIPQHNWHKGIYSLWRLALSVVLCSSSSRRANRHAGGRTSEQALFPAHFPPVLSAPSFPLSSPPSVRSSNQPASLVAGDLPSSRCQR